jgi:hypothetical protein
MDRVSASFTHSPTVAFRGARKYVHSTTLYEEILVGAKALGLDVDGPIELTVRRLMTMQPELRYSLAPPGVADDTRVGFGIEVGGVRWHGIVVDRGEPVVHRRPYDETPIWEHAVQEGKAIRLEQDTGMRPIEVVTALNLLLHRKLFSIAEGRHWYLARMYLARPLWSEDAQMVQLELARNFADRLTRSLITMGDRSIGYLEFMLGDVA